MAMQLRSISRMVRGERPTLTALILEMVALRHQIAVLKRSGTRRPCFRLRDRLFWILLARWWPGWRDSLVIVQPATVLRWRRSGLVTQLPTLGSSTFHGVNVLDVTELGREDFS